MRILTTVVVAALLTGCAALNSLETEVATYSRWPTDRKPSTYAFERLPSQQSRPDQQQRLEEAARPALEGAGFAPATDPKAADVTVQVGARITATDRSPFDDPFWWGPGFRRPFPYYGRPGRVFWGPSWRFYGGIALDYGYEREVALLIRDRRSGEPLFEASGSSDGLTPMAESALPAMFQAVMKDFPSAGANPRRVTVELKG